MTEEQIQRRRERDRERKARKRAEEKQLAKQKQAACIEIESAMQAKPPDTDMWTPFLVHLRRQQREHSK